MRKLGVHQNFGVAHFVGRRGDRATDAMTCEQILIAHTFESTADTLFQIAAVREKIPLCWPNLSEKVANDLNRLNRQRYDVGEDILRPFALLAHIGLQLLDHVWRNNPQPLFQIELLWGRQPQLARTPPSVVTSGFRVSS